MQFSKDQHKKKLLAVILFLLTILTVFPLMSVSASVDLLYFHANPGADFIQLEWETAQELDNLGFNIYRGVTNNLNAAQKLNSSLIPGNTGSPTGAYYEWIDNNVQVGTLYYYWLEDVDINSIPNPNPYGPESATAGGGSTIPTVPSSGGGGNNTSTPTPTKTPTRTPSPTTQSGTTATPSRTPTRTPTTQPTTSTSNSANPTATTAPSQEETTSNSSSVSVTSAPPNTAAATSEPVIEDTNLLSNDGSTPTPEPGANTAASAEETTTDIVAQAPGEPESNTTNSIGAAIGQNSEASAENSTSNENASDDSNRSTLIMMALIGSVILLIAGIGGTVVLLLKRNKANTQ